MRFTSPLRARALLFALAAALAGGVLVASAVPASADEAPAERGPRTGSETNRRADKGSASTPDLGFEAVLEALGRLRARAIEPRPEPGTRPEPAAERSSPAPTPAAEPEEESCVEAGDSNDVPRVVADIFLCRLAEAGVADPAARRIAVEAVVVSHCESRWDPNVVVFDGRYTDTPHPGTGSRYSAAGVFQFIRSTADQWIDGGYAQVRNPRRNIDAAARLFIHNRARGFGGWGDWACVAANDGFKVGSVLPGWPGGPQELPTWAEAYAA